MQRRFSLSALQTNAQTVRIVVSAVSLLILAALWPILQAAANLSVQDNRYVQILAGPLICLFLIYSYRNDVFSKARISLRGGLPLFILSVLLCLACVSFRPAEGDIDRLIVPMCAVLLLCESAFLLCFGESSSKSAIYALACLVLIVPIPAHVMDWASTIYQNGSAFTSYAIFNAVGISALRDGTTFAIPGLEFNIAPECSGIRSGLAFLLVALLASRLYLRSGWSRLVLVLLTIPIAMFKNAIRIVVTTALGAFVNRSFIDGPFHHQYGGLIFSPLDFLLFVPLLLLLQRIERRPESAGIPTPVPSGSAVSG